jgi:hypothetical protein
MAAKAELEAMKAEDQLAQNRAEVQCTAVKCGL